jgi:hypothetical protein
LHKLEQELESYLVENKKKFIQKVENKPEEMPQRSKNNLC